VGILPAGLNVQQTNREETIIVQDANYLMEAIRSGTRGTDDLTNYIYAITYFYSNYSANGTYQQSLSGFRRFTNSAPWNYPPYPLTNGLSIVGLLSMPKFTDANGRPINNRVNTAFYSNTITAD